MNSIDNHFCKINLYKKNYYVDLSYRTRVIFGVKKYYSHQLYRHLENQRWYYIDIDFINTYNLRSESRMLSLITLIVYVFNSTFNLARSV